MEGTVGTGPQGSAADWRASLRTELVAAMKARDQSTVSAFRTLIAAIDNADEIADRRQEAESYARLEQVDAAEALRRQADVLVSWTNRAQQG